MCNTTPSDITLTKSNRVGIVGEVVPEHFVFFAVLKLVENWSLSNFMVESVDIIPKGEEKRG